jgi:hypothetical protein
MNDLSTLHEDSLATLVLADGRECVGSWHMSSIKGFGRMYVGRIGMLAYRNHDTGGVDWKPCHPSMSARVDCDGLGVVGWRALPVGYVDDWSGQRLAQYG